MLSLICTLSGALALLFAVPAQAQTLLYASPDGSSTSTCDISTPCNLNRAQAYVETLTPSMASDIIVNLAAGTYTLSSTWTFNSANGDSGTGGHNVIWQASGYGTSSQASVTISGGQPVTATWTLWDSTNNIWKAAAPVNPLNTRQLYVNGQRAVRATGSLPVTLTLNGSVGYTASSNAMASWHNPSAIEVVMVADGFSESRCDVSSISGTAITMVQPCFGNAGLNATSVENAYELLSAPGQWYLDTSGSVDGSGVSTIYYIPRSGESMSTATVIVPVVETLLSGQGTLANPLQNIQFKGLTFAYGTWLQPSGSDGFIDTQENIYLTGTGAWGQPGTSCCYLNSHAGPGAVDFSAAHNIRLEGNAFIHLGGVGVNFQYGSQNNTIIGNEVADVSGNGIQLGNYDDYQTSDNRTILSNNTVQDNYVHDVAVEYHGGVGIFQGHPQNDVVTHNQVNNVPYDGIASGGGFGQVATVDTGNQFTDNLIYNVMETMADGGGIYTNGMQGSTYATGSTISGNVVHDQVNEFDAYYDDEGSDYITLQNNVDYNLPATNGYSWGGCYSASDPYPSQFMTFQNNYIPEASTFGGAWGCGTPPNLTITGNTQISGLSGCQGITACNNIVSNAGLEPAWQCLLSESCGGGGGGGGDTTVTFSDKPDNTPLTGVYAGIDWGSQLWYTAISGSVHYAWISTSSPGPLSQTFTLPAGKVLKSLDIWYGCAGSSVTVSSAGNTDQTFNPPSGNWTTYTTGWTTASATVTLTASCSLGDGYMGFTNIVYGDPPGDTTVTFADKPDNTPLTGVYDGIDWGSQLWYTAISGSVHYAWISTSSPGPLSQTFTLPAGKVLKSLDIWYGCAGSSVTVSSTGNTDQTFNPPTGNWTTYSTGWTTASATVTLTASCSLGDGYMGFTNFVYGSP